MLPYCAFPIGKVLRQVSRRNVVKWQPDSFQEMNNSARNPGEGRCRIFMKFPAIPIYSCGIRSRNRSRSATSPQYLYAQNLVSDYATYRDLTQTQSLEARR
jgi:hypothetical protein